MSARTEALLAQINKLDDELKEAFLRGEDPTSLSLERAKLIEQLNASNAALNESRRVLKS